MTTSIDLTPILQALIGLAAAILSGLAIWLGTWFKAWLATKIDLSKTQIDENLQSTYDAAILKGISYAETALEQKASSVKVDVRNEFVKTAVDYVLNSWPDLIKKGGLTPDRIEQHVIARLPSETTKRVDKVQEAAAAAPAKA